MYIHTASSSLENLASIMSILKGLVLVEVMLHNLIYFFDRKLDKIMINISLELTSEIKLLVTLH